MKHEVYVNIKSIADEDIIPCLPLGDEDNGTGDSIQEIYLKVNGIRLFIEPVEDGCMLHIQKVPKADPDETIEVMKLEIYNL
jgi:hypothetical protein